MKNGSEDNATSLKRPAKPRPGPDVLAKLEARVAALEASVADLARIAGATNPDIPREIENLQAYRKALGQGADALRAFFRSGGWVPPKEDQS